MLGCQGSSPPSDPSHLKFVPGGEGLVSPRAGTGLRDTVEQEASLPHLWPFLTVEPAEPCSTAILKTPFPCAKHSQTTSCPLSLLPLLLPSLQMGQLSFREVHGQRQCAQLMEPQATPKAVFLCMVHAYPAGTGCGHVCVLPVLTLYPQKGLIWVHSATLQPLLESFLCIIREKDKETAKHRGLIFALLFLETVSCYAA